MKVNIGKYPKNPKKDRKFKIEINDHDLSNIPAVLSPIILELLKGYKEKTVDQHPGGMTYEDWIYVIDAMIEAFEIIIRDNPEEMFEKHYKINLGFMLFSEYYNALWF